MKLTTLAVCVMTIGLAGCGNILNNINDAHDTITGQHFIFRTEKSHPQGYPCLTETTFYLSHGYFLYRTAPLSQCQDPNAVTSSGSYSYSKCGANCGHVSLYENQGKELGAVWDIDLCYKAYDHGTFAAYERGHPHVMHAGSFTVTPAFTDK